MTMGMFLQDAQIDGYEKTHPPSWSDSSPSRSDSSPSRSDSSPSRSDSSPSWSDMSLKSVLTTVVAGTQYLIHPQILGTIQETIKPDVIIPVTVLEPDQLYNHLEGTLRLFDLYDDVFTPAFGSVLIEKPGEGHSRIAVASSLGGGPASIFHLDNDTLHAGERSVSDMAAGPYILHGPNVHQAWRIYNDSLDAFASGVYPDKVDEIDVFHVLQLPSDGASNHTLVPVPSRLYNNAPPQKAPLGGHRFTIPDCTALKGVPTSISSASWSDLHNGTADATAAFAKRLIGLGAVVVGKTKSSQFGAGREWADVAAPKSAREDGHQDAAGGSTGAAISLAGYEWLRATTGIDAFGQTFETAAAQGLFALRTSTGVLPLDGAQVSSSRSDTISLFGTDLAELFRDATAVVHQSLYGPAIRFPKRLISVTALEETENRHADKHGEFVKAIESFLGVGAERVSLAALWAAKPPGGEGEGLQEYMRKAPFFSFCYEFYHQYAVFRKEYEAMFGKKPDVEATVLHQWSLGKNVSEAEYKGYQARIAVFRAWFNRRVMPLGDKGDAVLVMPFASDAPRYTAPEPETMYGVTTQLLGWLLGTPQVLAPFAQFPYRSNNSHETEYHPVYGTVLGPRGSDTMLIKLVEATFQKAGWRTKVDRGRFAFQGGG